MRNTNVVRELDYLGPKDHLIVPYWDELLTVDIFEVWVCANPEQLPEEGDLSMDSILSGGKFVEEEDCTIQPQLAAIPSTFDRFLIRSLDGVLQHDLAGFHEPGLGIDDIEYLIEHVILWIRDAWFWEVS